LEAGVYVFEIGKARAGIYVLVKTAIQKNRIRVILSPYTIPDVVQMVKLAGGEPVFVDNLPNSTNLDIEHLSRLLPDAACVLITHYHVTQNHLSQIRSLCRSLDVPLFDDCALAIGTRYDGVPIGCLTDASVFSMSAFKPLNYFLGGAIATSSSIRAQSVYAEIRNWPELTKLQYLRSMIRTAFFDIATQPGVFPIITFPIHKRSVLNSRREYLPQVRSDNKILAPSLMTRPSKAAAWELTRKLPHVEGHLLRRRSIASIYHSFFAERLVSGETEPLVMQDSSFIYFPIFVKSDLRDAVYRRLLSKNYHVGISAYPNVHEIAGFKNTSGRSTNVGHLVRSVITLPTHKKITEEYAADLAFAVRDAISVESQRQCPLGVGRTWLSANRGGPPGGRLSPSAGDCDAGATPFYRR